MLRNDYIRPGLPAASRWAAAASIALLSAGCSLPLTAKGGAPITTGSVTPPVEVRGPLPSTLAFSDAHKIGQAAEAALWQAGSEPGDWVNARTGSSGTLLPAGSAAEGQGCRSFSTTVTSVGGVHSYSGAACRSGETRTIVKIAEEALQNGS